MLWPDEIEATKTSSSHLSEIIRSAAARRRNGADSVDDDPELRDQLSALPYSADPTSRLKGRLRVLQNKANVVLSEIPSLSEWKITRPERQILALQEKSEFAR